MEGKKLRSIDDIARLAGVSKSTVSRALNDSPLVEEGTKRRIQEIARRHDFRPSSAARSLSLRSSRTIAFVSHSYAKDSCSISDPFSIEIMGGIARGLHELGYDLLLVHIDPDDTEWVGQYYDSGKVDGFILMTSTKKRRHLDLLRSRGIPFIAWGPGGGDYCSVCGDDLKGGRLAAERLLATGRRRIAHIAGPKTERESADRLRGFEAVLSEAGAGPDHQLIVHGTYERPSAATAMREILERDPSVDSVFCASDMMAIGAMDVLSAAGRRVPDDVAVIGYDDLNVAAYVSPALTTVSQHIPYAGRLLARDIVAFLGQGMVTTTIVPVELIVRDSA